MIVSSALLARKLAVGSKITSKNHTFSILHDAKFVCDNELLEVTISDGDLTYKFTIDVHEAENTSFTVPLSQLTALLNLLEDQPIKFSYNGRVTIESDLGVYEFPSEDPNDFPLPPEFEHQGILFPKDDFIKWFITASKFASTDELRPAMCGVHFNGKNGRYMIESTDAYTVYRNSFTSNDTLPVDVVIPVDVFAIVAKALGSNDSVMVSHNENIIKFQMENSVITAPLVNEKYPNVDAIIRKSSPIKYKIDKDLLLGSLKRVKGFNDYVVTLNVKFNTIVVESINNDVEQKAQERLNAIGDGVIKIGLNPKKMIHILWNIEDSHICLLLETNEKPIHVEADNALFLLMPIKIN